MLNFDLAKTEAGKELINMGLIDGLEKGEIKGKREGELKGKIDLLENLHLYGIISKEQYESMVAPLREHLKLLVQ
ncbi:Uncharacterized protein dnl_32370 [Desulfonema limicola]|uniref:Uncharacterized protein n=1 Tax=Desulfonema limicola TaxID=45656 RepID=A0A975B8U8_9BACT|nr:hypothetical protein [Desulfonema limicola]QTA80920.1 Uncharacterized protein dnl_32370 [Desulfonema limicola]